MLWWMMQEINGKFKNRVEREKCHLRPKEESGRVGVMRRCGARADGKSGESIRVWGYLMEDH